MTHRVALAAIWIVFMFPFPLVAGNETPDLRGSDVLSDLNISDLLNYSSQREHSTKSLDKKEDQWEERDPFFLPGAKGAGDKHPEKGEWRLTAIIYGDREGVAIINGTILREGDSILGVLVKKIQKDRVFLVEGDHTVELKVRRFTIE